MAASWRPILALITLLQVAEKTASWLHSGSLLRATQPSRVSPSPFVSPFPMKHSNAHRQGIATVKASGESGGKTHYDVDVTVIGSGPAGLSVAALLTEQHGLNVCLLDPKLDSRWIPNYGVWLEEWEALEKILGFSVRHCLMYTWEHTDLFCGGSHGIPINERLRVDQHYGRVDRAKLKKEFRDRATKGGAILLDSTVDTSSVKHNAQGSTFSSTDGKTFDTKLIIDCSGFSSKLIKRDGPDEPGVQVAYGIESVCDSYPYDDKAMLLMDYRTNYFENKQEEEEASLAPTFMYAMPMGPAEGGGVKVFWEETSLVARPPMSFDECKIRLEKRLKFHNCKVLKVEEVELCYIPMGGALPRKDQRVVAFGGSAGLVHPSTGYHICRALAAAGPTATAIAKELKGGNFQPDASARRIYDKIWTAENLLQRDFMVFGGEFLMRQDSANLRGFFDSFFKLPTEFWTGFLAGYPGLPNNSYHESWVKRLLFGIQLFLLAPMPLRFALAKGAILFGGLEFFRCVTPLAELYRDKPESEPPSPGGSASSLSN